MRYWLKFLLFGLSLHTHFTVCCWLKMHPSGDTSATLKTEEIIHDACEVQVDIFFSFKVRLL